MTTNTPLRLGVSSCLLGNEVRYNGGHKQDRWIRNVLGRFVDFAPVCPEVESGLGIPREPMRLVGDPENPRLVTTDTGIDHTARMQDFSRRKVEELAADNLCGFIFKARSPSSGMERVKVYNDKGMPELTGVGMFARAFMERFPRLPVEEDGRLNDPGLRENFIERIFAVKRWKDLLASAPDIGALVAFHTREKLLLLAHDPAGYKELGKLVAEAKGRDPAELFDQYEARFTAALAEHASVGRHVNVLQHAAGYFKDELGSDERAELAEVIDAYRRELVPLIVPVTLLNHYVRKYDKSYLAEQYYLHPHPLELKLRNHV